MSHSLNKTMLKQINNENIVRAFFSQQIAVTVKTVSNRRIYLFPLALST
jgi:hypothetical protein